MNKRTRSVIVFILILSLVVPVMLAARISLAADLPPEDMGSIPINTPFVINTALGEPHEGENWYMYYSFRTGPKKAYYVARIAEDTVLPQWHFSTAPDKDYRNWVGYSYMSHLSGQTALQPDTTYYLLIEKTRYPIVPNVTVTLEESVDDYGDTVDTGTTIYADKEYKGCAENYADQDVFIFNTGNTTYTMNYESSVDTCDLSFYTDKDLKSSYWSPLITGDHDASKKLEKNTTYYIKVRPERWEKVDYSIKMKSADPSQAVKDPGSTGAPTATTTPVTTPKPSATASPGATIGPSATPGRTSAPAATTAPGATSAPGTWSTEPGRDGYSAGRANGGVDIENTITSKDDVKVYYLDTGKYTYEIEARSDVDGTVFTVYSDIDLKHPVTTFTVDANGKTVDTSSMLEQNKRYYIVVTAPESFTEGQTLTYGFYLDPQSSSPSKPKTMNYKKYIKKNKYITNRISYVSAMIKGGRVKLKRYRGGYLFKLWKLGGAFRKSVKLKKKKYSFKLAKSCKIVWDEDADGKKGTIQSKKWFNKNFKKNGSMYSVREFGLCVNKKGRVVLIYTGDMFGAEQI